MVQFLPGSVGLRTRRADGEFQCKSVSEGMIEWCPGLKTDREKELFFTQICILCKL